MSYPINLDVAGRLCVVVGGGSVALRKVRGLLEAGANIFIIAPTVCDELKLLIEENIIPIASDVRAVEPKILWRNETYTVGSLPRGVLLIAASDDPNVNRLAALEGADKHMLVNVVNEDANVEDAVGFENPSVIRRGKFLLAISTGGASPALSKLIRRELEKIFDADFGQRLDVLDRLRDTVKHTIDNPVERINFWRRIINGEIFSPTVDSETLEVNIRNALARYRAQSQNRAD